MASETPSLVLQAKSTSLHQAIEFVQKGAVEASLPPVRAGELDLLIEELFVNVCRYAYPHSAPGTVTVTYWVPSLGELKVEIADQGIEFNPLKADPADISLDLEHRPIGGLGILLVQKLAVSLTYRREEGWNRLTFAISARS